MSETAPSTANRTLRRLPNAAYRPREYLTEVEVERLIEVARKRGRNGSRDAAAILLAYTGRALGRPNCAPSNGRRSTSGTAGCTSIGLRAGSRAFILYRAPSFEPLGHCRGRARMCS
jgi:hypothetical protein